MGSCGTGGWGGPKPGDPDNNSILTATPAFGGIDIEWTFPGVNPYAVAHTILYRGTNDNFAYAVQHKVVAGNFFYDKTTSATPIEYFYWISIISVNGTVGEVIGPASATARPTIDDMIIALTGRIDAGVLANSLKTEIDQITLNKLNITQEMLDRDANDDALGVALNEVIAHSDGTRALLQESVLALTTADDAIIQTVNTWLAELDPTGDDIAAVQVETAARIAADAALATQITTAQAALNGSLASVQTTLQTNITTVGDRTTAIGALYTAKVSVNGLIGGFGVYNDGTEVEAGFDVDLFWVGRTSANKKKPFIIYNDEVFIDNAVIRQLTADKIDTRGLTIRAADGTILFGSGTDLKWSYIATGNGKPADNATVGAPAGTLIAGVAAATVATAATNFNASNDRNPTAIASPVITTDGNAVDHAIQSNGSADISFEWGWFGTEGDIDGFLVYVYQGATNAAYTFGSNPAAETVYTVPANKRAFILFGVVPTAFYTFGVQAYRTVDKDINAAGVIKSALMKPGLSGENPYQPSTTLAWAGNVTGTIAGVPAADVNVWSQISGTGKPANNATVGANASNLAVGVGGNLIPNSDLAAGIQNWVLTWNQGGGTNYAGPIWDIAGIDWQPVGGHTIGASRTGMTGAASGWFDSTLQRDITVLSSTRYEASAYMACHRCPVSLVVAFYKMVSGVETYITEASFGPATLSGGQSLSNWSRVGGFFTTPADAQYLRIIMRAGAATAADPYHWGTKFFLGQALAGQTDLSPWSDGGSVSLGGLGAGALAKADTADWATQVGGSGKPASNATRNQIFRQGGSVPAGQSGDLWYVTSATSGYVIGTFYVFYAGFWQPASDTTANNIAMGIAGQGAFATLSQITPGNASTYIQSAAIGAALIGSIALVGVGNFSVKSDTVGARMEMDSRVIKIFDTGGVKRVQLGDLTL